MLKNRDSLLVTENKPAKGKAEISPNLAKFEELDKKDIPRLKLAADFFQYSGAQRTRVTTEGEKEVLTLRGKLGIGGPETTVVDFEDVIFEELKKEVNAIATENGVSLEVLLGNIKSDSNLKDDPDGIKKQKIIDYLELRDAYTKGMYDEEKGVDEKGEDATVLQDKPREGISSGDKDKLTETEIKIIEETLRAQGVEVDSLDLQSFRFDDSNKRDAVVSVINKKINELRDERWLAGFEVDNKKEQVLQEIKDEFHVYVNEESKDGKPSRGTTTFSYVYENPKNPNLGLRDQLAKISACSENKELSNALVKKVLEEYLIKDEGYQKALKEGNDIFLKPYRAEMAKKIDSFLNFMEMEKKMQEGLKGYENLNSLKKEIDEKNAKKPHKDEALKMLGLVAGLGADDSIGLRRPTWDSNLAIVDVKVFNAREQAAQKVIDKEGELKTAQESLEQHKKTPRPKRGINLNLRFLKIKIGGAEREKWDKEEKDFETQVADLSTEITKLKNERDALPQGIILPDVEDTYWSRFFRSDSTISVGTAKEKLTEFTSGVENLDSLEQKYNELSSLQYSLAQIKDKKLVVSLT